MSRSARLMTTLFLAIFLAAACGPGAGHSISPSGTPTPTATPTASASPSPSVAPTPTQTAVVPTPSTTATPVPPTVAPSPTAPPTMVVRAYFFLDDAAGDEPALVPVLRTVPSTSAVARVAMEMLLDGPTARERDADPAITTLVPAGTELIDVAIADGIATVDLSSEFAIAGGSSIRARLAQVVYTLTQFSAVDRVTFQLTGDPATFIDEAGVSIEGPLARWDFLDDFLPAIFVDRPAWGAAYLPTTIISGYANVFEAQFQLALLDGSGHVLAEAAVKATAGTGTWGRFHTTLDYEVTKAQWGMLRVWEPSAQDGSPINVREYPVWLRADG